jgi:hypothetical protein
MIPPPPVPTPPLLHLCRAVRRAPSPARPHPTGPILVPPPTAVVTARRRAYVVPSGGHVGGPDGIHVRCVGTQDAAPHQPYHALPRTRATVHLP